MCTISRVCFVSTGLTLCESKSSVFSVSVLCVAYSFSAFICDFGKMTGQQSTDKYCDNVLSKQNDKYRPPRTTGKFVKLPPINLNNYKNRAQSYPLSTINSSKKLQCPMSLQERLDKAKNNDSNINTTKNISSSLKLENELLMKPTISNNSVQTAKNLNFSKNVYKLKLSQPANDRLRLLRQTLASSDTIQEPIKKSNYYMNNVKCMQKAYQNKDFNNMPSTKSKDFEHLGDINHLPVNKLEDARVIQATLSSISSFDELLSIGQTYSLSNLDSVSIDEDLHKTTDQIIAVDIMTTESSQSIVDRCFKEAFKDYQKYQRVEERKRKSFNSSMRPHLSNTYANMNGSNSDEEANGY
ncbi:uncharacterized protein LOC131667238 [Phymastichus coffea]|uniref:uncharacterized protein LOC131667238 n=1 Tax=Phymastichus coffea TaxID=108790 RepID=UPI00273AAA06|nr:uncharacterized protein LOC131667238 [Phymastichus coffea]XP_058796520.1 uncharacterized protein LOC131667238 [Phymastichus coffea]